MSLYVEIHRIATSTQANGIVIFSDGTTALKLQIGANSNDPLVKDVAITLNVTLGVNSPNGSFYASVHSTTMTDMDVTSQLVVTLPTSRAEALPRRARVGGTSSLHVR
jgi:flagellin-like hook-associated protein FlgL